MTKGNTAARPYFYDNPDYNIPDESDLNPPTKKKEKKETSCEDKNKKS